MDRRDWIITILGLIVWTTTLFFAYRTGADAGYWEHEAEENVYGCQVLNAGVDIET